MTTKDQVNERIKDIKTVLSKTFEQIEQRHYEQTGISGLRTGYTDLDHTLSGLNKGDLIVLAARPGMGKSTFALNLATNVALLERKEVVVVSLEMSATQIAERMVGMVGNINSIAIRSGKLNEDEWEHVGKAIESLNQAPIRIIEDSFSLSQIQSDVRELKQKAGEIGLIVVDSLQLIDVDIPNGSSYERTSHIARSLKLLARELDCPIVAVTALSRTVEQRQDKHPILSDLRDSGCLEDDADVVIFLYCDDYYNTDSIKPNVAEVMISKHRNGPLGTVEFVFLRKYSKFLQLD
ncbi:DnaB-like helicase C-terminal domain-containing protein [Thermoactinomyces sp. DSM 45892]|uniref:replicative DNA helicase n=1 Tax=Thermoactinomyces sp. DSM 45892 TaxID=1882753 RepID=UPI000898368D|nr:DnaB-like helicase C-terminal domain-containing protein [Thermoactinomyces sp. DSM 45892]SDY83655.1 replicative DNA helicase [Thermoactinomyces sp. DSM 45892]